MPTRSRAQSFAVVFAAYAAALAGAALAGWGAAGRTPLFTLAVADVAATCVVWAFSTATRNSSLYDPYWSVAPPFLALFWILHPDAQAVGPRQALLFALIVVWAIRLTNNWRRGWPGLHHEDWRYAERRADHGALYPLEDLLGIHLLPTALVFLGCLPLVPALFAGTRPLGILDALGLAVAVGGLVLETVADEQLRRFVRAGRPGESLARGVWAWSRHPNYFGQLAFWWGLWGVGLAADPAAAWWTLAGPAAMTALFAFVSVPLMERRNLARRADYARVMEGVPRLVPRPPRRRRADA